MYIEFIISTLLFQAKLIDFNPLMPYTIPLPPSVTFVVANSRVVASKALTNQYNTRVSECRLAAQVRWVLPFQALIYSY